MIKFRKSQFALEFIATYGWAIMVILIMFSALSYFGVLNPSKILPSRCNLGLEFHCIDHLITYGSDGTDGVFKIKLRNSLGQAVAISSVELSSETETQFTCTTLPAYPDPWKSGETIDLIWGACNPKAVGFPAGEKAKISLTVSYYIKSSGSSYKRTVKGDVFSNVI